MCEINLSYYARYEQNKPDVLCLCFVWTRIRNISDMSEINVMYYA